MRIRKVKTIAGFELRRAITRPAYLLMTFGLPLFFGLIGGVPAYVQQEQLATELERTSLYAVVDESGLLFLDMRGQPLSAWPGAQRALPQLDGDTRLVVHETVALWPMARERAEAGLQSGEVEGVVVVPADYLARGAVTMIVRAGPSPLDVSATATRRHVRSLLVQGMLHERVSPEINERVRLPLEELEHFEMTPEGELRQIRDAGLSAIARMLVPVVLSMLLLMALMTTGGYLVQGIGAEKENRVIEVLLATVKPDEILAGKLLGLGGAGLLQFGVWALGFVGTLVAALGLLDDLAVEVPWGAVAIAPVLFVVGYLFYGSLMLATGSLGATANESQKLTMMWGMLALLPMLFLPMFLEAPHGLGALVMHWVPFTAPLAIVLRMAQDPAGVHGWEVAGSIVVLIVCTWLSVRIGARLFRVGVLLGGGWPGWRQVLRQAEITR
ncbi:MAG: ABC transporter permease [Sandaracinaceae bacterium]